MIFNCSMIEPGPVDTRLQAAGVHQALRKRAENIM